MGIVFGTAGIRGVVGDGDGQLNGAVVRRVALAYADTLRGGGAVALGYDTRLDSQAFAQVFADALTFRGIKCYMIDYCPVPILSFAVRHLRADGGVMITASHNPKQYNGIKIYNNRGGQIDDSCAEKITAALNNYTGNETVSKNSLLIEKPSVESRYLAAINIGAADGVKAVHTSLFGTGGKYIKMLLARANVDCKFVKSQSVYDGNFAGLDAPNPENKQAFRLAIALAKKHNSDVVFANDPDADRLGVAVRHGNKYVQLSGDQVGVLMLDYILRSTDIEGGVVIKSFVSTTLADKIADKYGARVVDTPVGFRFIAEKIDETDGRFVFAFEESCGYLCHTQCRDKDGLSSAVVFSQAVADIKKQGLTAIDRLNMLYDEFGQHFNTSRSYVVKDSAAEKLAQCKQVCGLSYTTSQVFGSLCLNLSDGSRIAVRPSGTEPKLKVYISSTGDNGQARLKQLAEFCDKFFG